VDEAIQVPIPTFPFIIDTAEVVVKLVPIPTFPPDVSVKLVAGALPLKLYPVPLVPPLNVPVALSVPVTARPVEEMDITGVVNVLPPFVVDGVMVRVLAANVEAPIDQLRSTPFGRNLSCASESVLFPTDRIVLLTPRPVPERVAVVPVNVTAPVALSVPVTAVLPPKYEAPAFTYKAYGVVKVTFDPAVGAPAIYRVAALV
jgi:hypothetical protein